MEHLTEHEREEIARQAAENRETEYRRKLIVLAAFIVVATVAALGGLTWWHAGLIARGETSIEGRINATLKKKFKAQGKKYKNPYDFGRKENWSIFLGLKDRCDYHEN